MKRCFMLFAVLASFSIFAQEPTKFFMVVKARAFAKALETHTQAGDGVLLDVRKPNEFQEGHIEGAQNIDFYSETFKDDLDELDRNKTYLVYCRSGGRSGRTSDLMKKMGFQRVYDLRGGIIAWKAGKQKVIQ
ncbi:rhodanese-like domain-containing protein [Acanthopleuribacter pedis]|uniref:Rhodanese-like domain-containing protein n=1 Tax=Acanthopleuribacter pedis TaxID=442870 RepID=A0A8J7QGI3_9BACT|nr:rhodanese-like domain-containing protein [Acanthopleuribacter pedis]MBO1319931.1 rhodanese-like domain-containing protein [Acanthopleuribacter pedis]